MKLRILFLSVLILCGSCGAKTGPKPPYEATWLELTVTENGYVVYNYPSLWNDGETTSTESFTIRGDSLSWIGFSDPRWSEIFTDVQFNPADSSYLFPIGNYFRFQWIDEDKHIARWIVYHGKEKEMRIMSDHLYIDSLHNTYPIVDYEWGKSKGHW